MSIGFGYGDIVTALRQGRQLYDSFADDFESAPAQMRELLLTSQQLRDTVEQYVGLFQSWGKQLPGLESIIARLDEADAWVASNRVLVHQPVGGLDRAKRIWRTGMHAFDGGRTDRIKNGLQLQCNMLIANVFLCAIQNAQNNTVHRQQNAAGSHTTRDSARSIDRLEQLSRKLLLVRNERERIAGESRRLYITSGSTANNAHIQAMWQRSDQRLQDLWAELWQGEGNRTAVPLLPVERDAVGLLPSAFVQGIVLNQDMNALHAPILQDAEPFTEAVRNDTQDHFEPLSPYSDASELSTPVSRVRTISTVDYGSPSTVRTTPAMTMPIPPAPSIKARDPGEPPRLLGQPSIPTHRATFSARGFRKQIKLDYHHFRTIEGRSSNGQYSSLRLLEWRGESRAVTIQHYIPAHPTDSFPYSKHSCFREDQSNLQVVIHTPNHTMHKVKITMNDKVMLHNKDEVTYRFMSEPDLRKFCSDLRDKVFLGSFEADKIKCRNGSHINECVKLWRSRDGGGASTLSFFANGNKGEDVELPLRWFRPLTKDESKRQVTLELIRGSGVASADTRANSRRSISSLMRRRSSSTQATNSHHGGGVSPISPHSRVGSVFTMDSAASSNVSDDYPTECPHDIHHDLRSIIITFTTGSHMENFLAAYVSTLGPLEEDTPALSSDSCSEYEVHSPSRSASSRGTHEIFQAGEASVANSDRAGVSRRLSESPSSRLPELSPHTPASKLFGRDTFDSPAMVRHPPGFESMYSDQRRLSPTDLDSRSPHSPHHTHHRSASTGFFGSGVHSYDVPELSSRTTDPEPSATTRTERYELEVSPIVHSQEARVELSGDSFFALDGWQEGHRFELDGTQRCAPVELPADYSFDSGRQVNGSGSERRGQRHVPRVTDDFVPP